MELFLQLLTIGLLLSLLLALAILLPEDSAGEKKHARSCNDHVTEKSVSVTPEPKLGVEPKNRGSESEGVVEVVEKIVQGDDDNINKSEPVIEKLEIHESVCEGCDCESPKVENLVDDSHKKERLREIEFEKNGNDFVKDLEDDWEWEGIERTELEKDFGAAVAFVGSSYNADRVSSLGSELKVHLYGLHKIATQGPCYEPQPMALKLSARAKWNAWQRLGNMSPEMAMEEYISVLSGSIPESMQDDFVGDHKHVLEEVEAFRKLASDLKTFPPMQPGAVDERKLEIKTCLEGLDVNAFGVQTP